MHNSVQRFHDNNMEMDASVPRPMKKRTYTADEVIGLLVDSGSSNTSSSSDSEKNVDDFANSSGSI